MYQMRDSFSQHNPSSSLLFCFFCFVYSILVPVGFICNFLLLLYALLPFVFFIFWYFRDTFDCTSVVSSFVYVWVGILLLVVVTLHKLVDVVVFFLELVHFMSVFEPVYVSVSNLFISIVFFDIPIEYIVSLSLFSFFLNSFNFVLIFKTLGLYY